MRPLHLPTPGACTFRAVIGLSLLGSGLPGCDDSEAIRPGDIRSYTAPAPLQPIVPEPAQKKSLGLDVSFDPPAGWTDRGASGMRLACLVIDSPRGQHEVTVIPAAGTLEANVTRWLGQLDDEATAERLAFRTAEVLDAASKVLVGDAEATIVALMKPSAADDDEVILAAMIPIDESDSLFVKFKGPAAVAREQREAFNQFVSSIRWNQESPR